MHWICASACLLTHSFQFADPQHVVSPADDFDALQRATYMDLHGIALSDSTWAQGILPFRLGGHGFTLTRPFLHGPAAARIIDAAPAREQRAAYTRDSYCPARCLCRSLPPWRPPLLVRSPRRGLTALLAGDALMVPSTVQDSDNEASVMVDDTTIECPTLPNQLAPLTNHLSTIQTRTATNHLQPPLPTVIDLLGCPIRQRDLCGSIPKPSPRTTVLLFIKIMRTVSAFTSPLKTHSRLMHLHMIPTVILRRSLRGEPAGNPNSVKCMPCFDAFGAPLQASGRHYGAEQSRLIAPNDVSASDGLDP